MILVEDIGFDGFSKNIKMPLVNAIDKKKKLESMGGVVKENKIYTSGPRTMFKFIIEFKKELNDFSTALINVEIKGEFITSNLSGTIDIDINGKMETNYPTGGFMMSCLMDYYNKYLYSHFLKYAKDEFSKIKDVIE